MEEFTQWFLLFSAVFWLGAVAIMSIAGGWHRLTSRFRAASGTEGEHFAFVSMYIRDGLLPVGYRGCLFVTVSPTGVRLSTWFPLRFLHPPLFIPWSAVSSVQSEALWSLMYTAVHLRDFRMRLLFSEPIGRKLVEAFNARFSIMRA